MWTIITWSRDTGQWYHMRGLNDEWQAFGRAKEWAKEMLPLTVISLSDPAGKVVWAEIGSHPVIGRCSDDECWCNDHPADTDHTLELGSSNA